MIARVWPAEGPPRLAVTLPTAFVLALVVLLLPVLGLILWFFLGPRDRKP